LSLDRIGGDGFAGGQIKRQIDRSFVGGHWDGPSPGEDKRHRFRAGSKMDAAMHRVANHAEAILHRRACDVIEQSHAIVFVPDGAESGHGQGQWTAPRFFDAWLRIAGIFGRHGFTGLPTGIDSVAEKELPVRLGQQFLAAAGFEVPASW